MRLSTPNGTERDASAKGKPNAAGNVEPLRVVKRKRHRTPSLDAEIRNAAKQIIKTQMAEAYKAAALGVVARKLDEVKAILNAAGFVGIGTITNHVQPMAAGVPSLVPQQVENPCCQCGRPGVRRTRPNNFNPTGSWFCAAHQVLAARSDFDDAMDRQLIGAAPPMTQRKPVLVQTQAPAVMRPQVEQPAPPAPEPTPEPQPAEPPADQLKAAMNALGV